MGLKEDFEDTIEIWKRGSLLWKLVTSVGFLLGCVTLLSIGDTVFEFKGAIIRVIEFYRAILSPVSQYLGRIYKLGPYDVDVLVFASLLWVAFGRVLVDVGDDVFADVLASILTSGIFVAASLLVLVYLNWIVLVVALAAIITGLVLVICDSDEPEDERREDRLILEYFVGQLLLAFFLVAISEGAMRPLS